MDYCCTGASYRDYGDPRVILGVIVAMAAAVLVIVCVVHRRRRRARHQRKSAERRRLSADALALAALAEPAADGGPDCPVRDGAGSLQVRYVGRASSSSSSANCVPMHAPAAAGNSVTSSAATHVAGGKRLLKEKTEKVSIV